MAPSSAQARANAHRQWAHCPDRSARTSHGTAAFLARFETQVDPDGLLAPAERAKRAESAKRAYFTDLALRSAASRRKNAEQRSARVAASGPGPVRVVPHAKDQGSAREVA